MLFKSPETIIIDTPRFYCDGGNLRGEHARGLVADPGKDSGHPRVYLTMTSEGSVDCPYCGRRFVLAQGAKSAAAH